MRRESVFRVPGSSPGVSPPASTLLESLGIPFNDTFDAAHLQPAPELVVIGNIIARGNPELEEVFDRKIPYRSMLFPMTDRKSTRLNSSHANISYAVFCFKK